MKGVAVVPKDRNRNIVLYLHRPSTNSLVSKFLLESLSVLFIKTIKKINVITTVIDIYTFGDFF